MSDELEALRELRAERDALIVERDTLRKQVDTCMGHGFDRAELFCSSCGHIARELSHNEALTMRAQSQLEWPRIECGHCGYKGIGNLRQFFRDARG